MQRNRPSSLKLTRYIEAMIAAGKFQPGEQLPPLRQLAEIFHLSPSTARRAVKELCDRGTLEFRHGSGTFVAPRLGGAKGGYTLSVFNQDWVDDSYCAYALRGLQNRAAYEGWQLRLFFYNIPLEAHRPLPQEAWESDAVAFFGCYDLDRGQRPCEIPDSKPLVALEMHENHGGLFSTVTLDPFTAANLACRHFAGLGLKHVVIVEANMPIHMVRSRVFQATWAQYGTSEVQLFDECGRLAEVRDNCGYFFDSGSNFQFYARRYREEHGELLAAHRNVLAVDGKSLIFPDYEPANTVSIDWMRAGELAFDECVRRVLNPGSAARRIYIEPTLNLFQV